ncbi:GAF domain-containing protein [Prosthecobacter sp.]|uniref:GAF domain-containing protein n=1 Tax=Prosthecobacter sp. TaxID=1965333 RepID=UPI002486EDC2|nr:GAF domain-containing protein [Prosthecobacter sp.]MDI1314363.1 GAF domain-containing protein [Prosthecobacter sp.]
MMKKPRETSLQIRLATITILGLLVALAAAAYLSGRQVQRDSELIAQDAVPGTINAHYMRMAISRSIGWVLVAGSAQTAQLRDSSLKVAHDEAAQKVLPAASAGVVEGYLDLVNIDLRDKARSSGPSGRSFLSGEHVTCIDVEHDPLMAPWREEMLKRGYRSSASFPLKAGGKVSGVFTLHSDQAGFFNDEEMLLLDELAMGHRLRPGGERSRYKAPHV